MLRRSFFLSLLLPLLFTGACSDKKGNTLTIGMEMEFPPFEMKDTNGTPTGVSVEIAYALGKKLGRPVELENIKWAGLIPSLQSRKIDIILSSLSASEERKKSIAFSEPYIKTGLAMLVGKDSPIKTGLEVFQPGMKVAVREATTSQQYAKEFLKSAKVTELGEESACVQEVIQGKVDAFVYDQIAIFKHHQQNPETTRALLKPLRTEYWAIGLRKEDDELRGQINKALAELKAEGLFDRLSEKFLKEANAAFKAAGVPFLFQTEEAAK